MNNEKRDSKDMSAFELGHFMAQINTKMDDMGHKLSEVISDFKVVHKDHELRIRSLEKDSATKEENKRAHARIDKLQATIWRIVVYLAAGGSVTGGSIAIYNALLPAV